MNFHKIALTICLGSLLAACGSGGAGGTSGMFGARDDHKATIPGDPQSREFSGTIVSLRPITSTMLVSKDEHIGRDAFPNIVTVKYDAQTQFFLDNAPTTLDKIEQYMNVTVHGRMRDGALVADAAHFSSALPANVRRPAAGQASSQ